MAIRKATEFIVVHCSATPEGKYFDREDIDRMHRDRGFSRIGYHYVVLLDGTVQTGREVDEVGAHVSGKNSVSVGVCYIGGLAADGKTAKDTRTPEQKRALIDLLQFLKVKYPKAPIVGHRDFSIDRNRDGIISPYERMKECPCFDAIPEYAWIKGLPDPTPAASSVIVKPGDTLYALARQAGTTVDDLAKANGINPNAPLQIGVTLVLPKAA